MLDASEVVCLSLSGESSFGFGGLRGHIVCGGGLGRGFCEGEGGVVMGLVRGLVAGLGGGAGEGILGVWDDLIDFVGGARFWGGLSGRKSCGANGMGDGELILVGETGATGCFGLRGKGALLFGREKRISSIFVRVSSVSWMVEEGFGIFCSFVFGA